MEDRQGRRDARGTGSPTAGGSCPDSFALSYNLCSSFAYHGPQRQKSRVARLAVVHQRAFENPSRVQCAFVHSSSCPLSLYPRAGWNHAQNLRPARTSQHTPLRRAQQQPHEPVETCAIILTVRPRQPWTPRPNALLRSIPWVSP